MIRIYSKNEKFYMMLDKDVIYLISYLNKG